MAVTLFQIIIVVFALFALSRAVLRLRGRQISISQFLFWSVLWILVIVVVIVPKTTDFFAKPFGIGRGADFVIYLSIAILFYAIFKMYVRQDNLETNLTALVRELSYLNAKKEQKNVRRKKL